MLVGPIAFLDVYLRDYMELRVSLSRFNLVALSDNSGSISGALSESDTGLEDAGVENTPILLCGC